MKIVFLIIFGTFLIPLNANAITCKSYRTCEQAVKNWCEGSHPRADGDGDGIPFENVCKSKAKVNAIRKQINC